MGAGRFLKRCADLPKIAVILEHKRAARSLCRRGSGGGSLSMMMWATCPRFQLGWIASVTIGHRFFFFGFSSSLSWKHAMLALDLRLECGILARQL